MVGPGKSGEMEPKVVLFDYDEIQQLDLNFLCPSNRSNTGNTLIPLASGGGYTTKDALSKAYSDLIKGPYEQIRSAELEKQLGVEQTVLYNVLRTQDDFILSVCQEFVVTKHNQERILSDIHANTRSTFIRVSEITKKHAIDIRSVAKLITFSKNSPQDLRLHLLDTPDSPGPQSFRLKHAWVHTRATLLILRSNVIDMAKAAHTAARVAKWGSRDMFGLDIPTFSSIAYQFCQEFNGHEPLYGFFKSDEHSVCYVTKSYLLRKAKRALKEVAMGAKLFCNFQQLVFKYPTLLPNVETARRMALTEVLHKNGKRYRWHFVNHYAIGDVALNTIVKRCMETLGTQRYLNTEVSRIMIAELCLFVKVNMS
jgi:hypothetical protein